ncbi:hypothetical protein E2C01_056712 [Portunus trituberculatus]|uniref:Uncharacterized protein n=1 Tax=Portunus trituberculatus TaxID=210409 RepID=A0A5B7GY69_PORTR|nr:hypothetical protein [Portunus trituberculatus]
MNPMCFSSFGIIILLIFTSSNLFTLSPGVGGRRLAAPPPGWEREAGGGGRRRRRSLSDIQCCFRSFDFPSICSLWIDYSGTLRWLVAWREGRSREVSLMLFTHCRQESGAKSRLTEGLFRTGRLARGLGFPRDVACSER